MPEGVVTARWKPPVGAATRPVHAQPHEDHFSASGQVIRREGHLVTLRTENGAEVVVQADWIDPPTQETP